MLILVCVYIIMGKQANISICNKESDKENPHHLIIIFITVVDILAHTKPDNRSVKVFQVKSKEVKLNINAMRHAFH